MILHMQQVVKGCTAYGMIVNTNFLELVQVNKSYMQLLGLMNLLKVGKATWLNSGDLNLRGTMTLLLSAGQYFNMFISSKYIVCNSYIMGISALPS